jgi:excisionase family DNA binding protein
LSIDHLKTAQEAAEILSISKKSIHALCRRGLLSYVRVNAKERRFTDQQLLEYVEAQTVPRKVDKTTAKRISSPPPRRKGGESEVPGGSVRAHLREEMRSWQ